MTSSTDTAAEQGGASRLVLPLLDTDLIVKAMAYMEGRYGREHRGIYALAKPLLESWERPVLDIAALDAEAVAALEEYSQSVKA